MPSPFALKEFAFLRENKDKGVFVSSTKEGFHYQYKWLEMYEGCELRLTIPKDSTLNCSWQKQRVSPSAYRQWGYGGDIFRKRQTIKRQPKFEELPPWFQELFLHAQEVYEKLRESQNGLIIW